MNVPHKQPYLYCQYIVVILVFLPSVAFQGKIEPENTARANHIRFQLVLLLFRVGLAISLATWLQVAFQQEHPCTCAGT